MKKAVLILPDNTIYRGKGIGAYGSYIGELVFNTSMTGYVEALTDPSYAGQILTFAYPLIGNYGVSNKWTEAKKIYPTAIIASEISQEASHYEKDCSFEGFLKKHKLGGIAGIDTRSLIKKIRDKGTIPAVISVYENHDVDWVNQVTTKKPYIVNPDGKTTVVLIDYGTKGSIISQLIKQDLKVIVIPAFSTTNEIVSYNPSGIILSNGPGDPTQLGYAVDTIKELLHTGIPMWGICLGHQLLALASGGKTFKLPFGHRGINQPVKHTKTKKAYITSHNHGYAVDPTSLPKDIEVTYTNLNDGAVEGMCHKKKPWFSVQFHPEANPGPYDTQFLFNEFKKLL